MATRAALPQLEELESRRVLSATAAHLFPPGGYDVHLTLVIPIPPRPSAWPADAVAASPQPRGYRSETADDLEDAREGGEDTDKAGSGSSGHGGGSSAVTMVPVTLPLGAGGDATTPTVSARTSFAIQPYGSTDSTASLLRDGPAASLNDPTPDARAAGGSLTAAALKVTTAMPAWVVGGGEELAAMPATARVSWLARFSSEPMLATWRSIAMDAKPLAAAAEVAVSSVLREAVSTAGLTFAADSTGVAAAPLLTATRPDAVMALADAMTRFAYESAAVGPLFTAATSGSHARAWAITGAAVLGDAALVAYLYANRRKAAVRTRVEAQ